MVLDRPAWIEVDLGTIAHNVRLLRASLPEGTALLAVVKANAYGHGAIPVARAALDAGAALLGVTCLDEALELRRAGISASILMLGYAPPEHADLIVEYGIIANCFSSDVLAALDRAARKFGAIARVHLKVDTGMGRLGPLPADFAALVEEAGARKRIRVEGIFTHFASADQPSSPQTSEQLRCFTGLIKLATSYGLRPRYIHAANSAAMLTRPDALFNLVRIGAAIYGLRPSLETPCLPGIEQALTFKTLIAQVKDVPAGQSISYGATYTCATPTRIAVLQAGYADGLRRSPHNWDYVLIRGHRAPIRGVVCMDLCMVDVTGIPGVQAGDEAVIIGAQGSERISFEEVAERAQTINYEVVCQLASRLPRIYFPDVKGSGTATPRQLSGISRDGSSVQSA